MRDFPHNFTLEHNSFAFHFNKQGLSRHLQVFVDKLYLLDLRAIFLYLVTGYMSVFVRTEEGQEAAYSPQSALPRKLKSILKVIDGRTTIDAFETNLSSFGDVRAILQSLDMAGLIKLVDGASNPGTPSADAGASGAVTPNKPVSPARSVSAPPTMAAASSAPFAGAQFGAWIEPKSAGPDASNSISMDSWQASQMATQAMPAARQMQSPALQAIVDSMSLFVLTHLPDQSFQILKEIEEITSLELLAVTLGGYEQLVSVVGEPSVQHLKTIKQALRDNL